MLRQVIWWNLIEFGTLGCTRNDAVNLRLFS